MIFPIFEAQHFDKNNFGVALARGEYANCTFNGCDFAGGDLSGFKFLECQFADCNPLLAQPVKEIIAQRFADTLILDSFIHNHQIQEANLFGFIRSRQSSDETIKASNGLAITLCKNEEGVLIIKPKRKFNPVFPLLDLLRR